MITKTITITMMIMTTGLMTMKITTNADDGNDKLGDNDNNNDDNAINDGDNTIQTPREH